jgi:rhodanese-related sulfurtransferase
MIIRVLLGAGLMLTAATAQAEGNRYKYPREYKADISPAVAQRILTTDKSAVLVDVRSIEEFTAGHAPNSDHIPYPRVKGKDRNDPSYMAMSPEEFLAEVSKRHPDKSTPILTMCASGGRSAMAANILAKAGYSNVSSVWTGYTGLPLKDVDGNPVDVNGNGVIHGVTLDAEGKPKQDGGDLDGWAGFNDLPTTTAIDKDRVLERLSGFYTPAKP